MEREIRIAVVGDENVGKTTFLASLFGNLRDPDFMETHGYRLTAENPGVSKDLLNLFHGLQENKFPATSALISRYAFDVQYVGQGRAKERLGEAIVRILLRDYPGEWFSKDVDKTDKSSREATVKWLADAHVGVILLDGKRYLAADGDGYIRATIDQLGGELAKARTAAADRTIELPWIIAVTKADLLPEDATAATIGQHVREVAGRELRAFDMVFDGRRQIGSRFLLLSSVLAKDPGSIDASRWIGLSTILPYALRTTLLEVIELVASSEHPGPESRLMQVVKALFGLVRGVVRVLPKKYRPLAGLLVLGIDLLQPMFSDLVDERDRKRMTEEVREGFRRIMAELDSEVSRRAYADLGAL